MRASAAPEVPVRSRDPDAMRRARRSRRRAAASRRSRFGRVALGLDVAVAALFGIGLGARYVAPPTAWPVQVVALTLPLASVGVAAAGAVWLVRAARVRTRRAWAATAVHAGLVGLALARYGLALTGTGAVTAPTDDVLRVLSLNAGKETPAAASLAADIATMVEPDVIALQETLVREMSDEGRVAAGRAAMGFLAGADLVSTGEEEKEDRLAALVRPSVQVGGARGGTLDPTDPETAGVMKRVELAWQGRPFALYVVHFRSYGRSGGPLPAQAREVRADLASRAREARALRTLLDAEDLPFLVVGDFNATPDQWTYAHVASGLQDALVEKAGWVPTFPDDRPVIQIDAVLASPEWAVEAAEVLPSGLSDHRGVLADLRWRR